MTHQNHQDRQDKYSKTGKSNVRTSKSHERRVAKLLTEWSHHPFRRRRIEGRGDDVKVVEGVADVIPVQGDPLFVVEAKKGKQFSFDSLMTNPTGCKFTEWWHQVSYDAQVLTGKTGITRHPMLFFKPHPNWDWVAVPFSTFEQGILQPHAAYDDVCDDPDYRSRIWFPHLLFDAYSWIGPIEHNISQSKNKIMKSLRLLPVVITRWRDFSQRVDPKCMFIQHQTTEA